MLVIDIIHYDDFVTVYDMIEADLKTPDDITILNEIEQLLSISLPRVSRIIVGRIGYKITHNRITQLSLYGIDSEIVLDKIFSLEKLEKLILNESNLSFLPDTIGNLKNLQVLLLKGNSLVNIPQSLLNLPNLRILDLSNNNLKTWNLREGELPLLKVLEINHNKLELVNFGENASFLLEELYVNHNNVITLNVDHLINLRNLSAQYNNLEAFPKVNNFKKLSVLELDYNHIKEFSINVDSLPNLENLSINYNKIENIDFSNKKFQKLPHFYYSGNPIDKKCMKQLQHFVKAKAKARARTSSIFFS